MAPGQKANGDNLGKPFDLNEEILMSTQKHTFS